MKRRITVVLDVTACESSTGIEFEHVRFYTRHDLNAEALEDAISHIDGCHEMYHFEYDCCFGQGGFTLICGWAQSGEYEVELLV